MLLRWFKSVITPWWNKMRSIGKFRSVLWSIANFYKTGQGRAGYRLWDKNHRAGHVKNFTGQGTWKILQGRVRLPKSQQGRFRLWKSRNLQASRLGSSNKFFKNFFGGGLVIWEVLLIQEGLLLRWGGVREKTKLVRVCDEPCRFRTNLRGLVFS